MSLFACWVVSEKSVLSIETDFVAENYMKPIMDGNI